MNPVYSLFARMILSCYIHQDKKHCFQRIGPSQSASVAFQNMLASYDQGFIVSCLISKQFLHGVSTIEYCLYKYTSSHSPYMENDPSELVKPLGITGLLDFVPRPVFSKKEKTLENTEFRKRDLFPSSGEGGDIYAVGSVRKS
jgi:hypothetical protein